MMLEISAGKVDRENLACNESQPIGSATAQSNLVSKQLHHEPF